MIGREYWSEFHHDSAKKVSGKISFENLLVRFKETHPLKPQKADGRRPQAVTKQQIDHVKEIFRLHPFLHVQMCPAAWTYGPEHSRTR